MAANAEYEDKKLSEIFNEGLSLFEQIESSNGPVLQADVRKCIDVLERCTKLVNIGGLFSSNENIEEVTTTNIKFLLLPAYLGFLTLKLQNIERILILETSEVYFKDFLKRVRDYEIVKNIKIDEGEEEAVAVVKKKDLNDLFAERNEKIKKYNEQKELNEMVNELKNVYKVRGDEEVEREYYLMVIKQQVGLVEDELNAITQEKPLATRLSQIKTGEVKPEKKKIPPKPLTPIILTKNEIQKKVFGAGYPSLPTMTVQEFYDQRVAEGIFPAHGSTHVNSLQQLEDPEVKAAEEEKDDVKKEIEVENDDPEYLEKSRRMDEYKDTHKRGWGNRSNRS